MTDDEEPTLTGYTFIDGGGETVIEGKPHWPHVLTVRMSKYQAFAAMQVLLQQVRYDSDEIVLTVVGQLTEDEE